MSISSNLKSSLVELAKKFELDLFVLFGSRAGHKSSKNSDYDLAFYKKNISVDEQLNLIEELESIFEGKKFDLVDLEKNDNSVLRKDIFFKGVCLFEKKKFLFEKEKEIAYFDYVDSFALLKPSKDKFLSEAL